MLNTSSGIKPFQFYSMADIKRKNKFETSFVVISPIKKQKVNVKVERQNEMEARDDQFLPGKHELKQDLLSFAPIQKKANVKKSVPLPLRPKNLWLQKTSCEGIGLPIVSPPRPPPPEKENEDGMSEYEKMIQKNIERKMEFLASLNVNELKQEMLSFAPIKKKANVKKSVPLPLRPKSLRLQKKTPEGIDLPIVSPPRPPPPPPPEEENEQLPKPHRPLLFSEVFVQQEDLSLSNLFCDSVQSLADEKFILEPVPYNSWEKHFKNMRTNSSLTAKVVKRRIWSLAVHPTISKTLVCAGGNFGHLGFWDVESSTGGDGVFLYQPHSAPVTCLAFNMNKPCQVISSSYDGTLRCGNFEKAVFDEVYYTDDYNIGVTSFDFLSSHSILLSQNDGRIAVVDTRTPNQEVEISHTTHPSSIKTVSVHPVKRDFFIASGRNGIVSLWDLRNLKKFPLSESAHTKVVHSAYFSPLSGKYILTSSSDNNIRIFDSANLHEDIKLKKAIGHGNFAGRWLTPFRPVWVPNNEDTFVVGSHYPFPRRIEVFNIAGSLVHVFTGKSLQSICSINAFHPTKQILAGGNSSGKVHIFKIES